MRITKEMRGSLRGVKTAPGQYDIVRQQRDGRFLVVGKMSIRELSVAATAGGIMNGM